ncbi:MAG TPA: M1 family aminopeptidase/hydrolase, partial [Myxococcales bacterium]|nr:M1 family aminopeptidase/hydrolase [Myxococcales bacterium]
MARLDPHSYADSDQPQTRSIEFDLEVDFDRRVLRGEIALWFGAPASGALDLDTRDLKIAAVEGARRWELGAPERILGGRLRLELAGVDSVRIRYQTSPQASALQWLPGPFFFTQCQPIHARSIFPLQDTPRVRVTVRRSRLRVPAGMQVLMAAAAFGGGEFEMPQPIPPYLLAFAAGDLVKRDLSPRCAVWAQPSLADAAAWEFAEVEKMLAAAEQLFGPYEWDRYDILVMPPSFPYGGMENPRLTFATPSLLAGDRSLVNVIAHELAHAWTGNLVTNASANDFWLNEGFTVYAERRILEELLGRDGSELHAAIGRHDLEVALQRFANRPELTKLRTNLEGIDPDEAYSTVPYEKGYLLLRRMEEIAGREQWDSFLRSYLAKFRFQSITTQDFLDQLPAALRPTAGRWVDSTGLPDDAPVPQAREIVEPRDPTELLVFLHAQKNPDLDALDRRYGLSQRKSLELRTAFVGLQLEHGAPGAVDGARRIALET